MIFLKKKIFYRWFFFFLRRNNYFLLSNYIKNSYMFKYFRNLNYFFYSFFKKQKIFIFLKKKQYLSFFLKKAKLINFSKSNYLSYRFYNLFTTLKYYKGFSLHQTLKFFFHNLNFFFINFFFINFFFINFFFINGLKVLFYFNLILPLFVNIKFPISSLTLQFLRLFFLFKRRIYRFIRKRNILFRKKKLKTKIKTHNKYFIFFNYKLSQYLLGEFTFLSCSIFLIPLYKITFLYKFIPINFFYKNIYFWQKKFFVDVL